MVSLALFSSTQLLLLSVLALPALLILRRVFPYHQSTSNRTSVAAQGDPPKKKSIMQPEATNLAPPKDDPFKLEQLKQYDGSDPSKPIYLSIKGTVFDVTNKSSMYGPGGSYHIFAGKDGSRGLGMSSLKPEDAVPDCSNLPDSELKVLDDWLLFFSKRYNIVGRVIDLPSRSAPASVIAGTTR